MASRVLFSPASGDVDVTSGPTHVHMGKRGSIDIDVGTTHLHLNRPAVVSYGKRADGAAPSKSSTSPIKQLNDAVDDLSNTYARAITSLETAENNHMKKSYYRSADFGIQDRSVLDVLREKLDLENELASRSLIKSGKVSALIKTRTNAQTRSDIGANLRSSPFLNIASPYLANLDPKLRPYADRFLTERVMVRKLMEDGKLCRNLRVATAEANGNLRNWILEYSGMGSYTSTRMLEIAQKIQDLLQQIKEKDEAYTLLDEAVASTMMAIEQLKRTTTDQQLADATQLDDLIGLTTDLQAKLKQTNSDGVEFLKQLKGMQSSEQTLQVLQTELTTELADSKARVASLARQQTDQTARLAQQYAVQAAANAAREQLLNEKIQSAREGLRKQEKLRDTLQPEKATLEATVRAAKADKKETGEELNMACDIANKLKESLEKELTVAQFWQDSAQELSRRVMGIDARDVKSLVAVGAKYTETVDLCAQANASIEETRTAIGSIRVIAMKELLEIQEEHKRVKSLSKHLVEEEHHEKDLVVIIEMVVDKFRQLRSLAILNDAKHKKNEADISMLIETCLEDRDNDEAEMNRAVEIALKRVEEAKLMATNAKAISATMDRDIRYDSRYGW